MKHVIHSGLLMREKYGKITVTLQRENSFGEFITRKILMEGEQV